MKNAKSRYTGKERDTESGLDYFGARYYSSSMGRFSSPDPGWFFASRLENPQTWNQYSYVLNNPLSATDPDGYDCVYLNNAGNGVESVDQNSSQGECSGDANQKGSGGFWVNGTATQVTLYSNSNDVGLSGQNDDGSLTASSYGQHQNTDQTVSTGSRRSPRGRLRCSVIC
jgi:RHS repeat-associated protein